MPHQDQLGATLARAVRSRAESLSRGGEQGNPEGATATLSRKARPRITEIKVDLEYPEWAWLKWNGTPPDGEDSFMVSTGKGYSDPLDPRNSCNRECCDGEDTQCAPPFDKPRARGSCCTPVGTFRTGRTRYDAAWPYWTPVEPLHTEYKRYIALHQHNEVTGEAIGHGCIRMEEAPAKRIADYHIPGVTKVVIGGRAKVACASHAQCGNPDRL